MKMVDDREDGGLRPWDEVSEAERAKLVRARGVTGAKLAALMPTWLKSHLRAGMLAEPFRPDFRVVLPSIASLSCAPSGDPHKDYYFPKDYGGQPIGTAEYVAAFLAHNNLVQ